MPCCDCGCYGGCCCRDDAEDEKVTRIEDYDPSHGGPNKDRSCTDVLCLLLFLLFLVGWGVVSVVAFATGNPVKLIYPSDSNGEICGSGDQLGKPHLLFFDLTRCAKLSAALTGCATPQVCVADCPNEYWTYTLPTKSNVDKFCTGLEPGEFESKNVEELVKIRKCPAFILPSTSVLGRCVPTFGLGKDTSTEIKNITTLNTLDKKVDQASLMEGIKYIMDILDIRGIGSKLVADLAVYWWILLVTLIFAMVISLFWIALLRCAAAPLIWLSILLCILLLCTATGLAWYRYYVLVTAGSNAQQDDIFLPPVLSNLSSLYYKKEIWLGLGIVLSIITFVILIILIFLRSRIRMAVELIEEASKAVGSAKFILAFPLGPFIVQGFVIFWFCLVASFLASAGEKEFKVVDMNSDCTSCTNPDTGSLYKNNDICDPGTFNCTECIKAKCVFYKHGPTARESWLQVYNVFGLVWVIFFVQAFGEMVMAGVFSGWYWTMDKEKDLPSSPLLSSIKTTCRYHLGSLAFGTLILGAVRMIRILLEYIEEKLKKYTDDNPVVKAVTCMCKCCFYCLENCLRFLNRNSYIMTAVYGYNFCTAARKSFFLLARNLVRVVVLDKVTDFILFLGKMIVVGLVTGLALLLFQSGASDLDIELNYQIVPIGIIVLCSYAIASTFFSVYNMAVDTIFLSFLEDIELHDGSPENPYFMDDDLKELLGLMNKSKETEAEKEEDAE